MRFDNIDERTVIKSANDEYDDKRNMYSPEIFLSDDAFDPDLKYLNSPATIDVLGKCCLMPCTSARTKLFLSGTK